MRFVGRQTESTLPDELVAGRWQNAPHARPYITFGDDEYAGIEHHHAVTTYPTTLTEALRLVVAVQADHLARGWTDTFYAWFIFHALGIIIEGRGWGRSQGSENTWDPDGTGALPSGFLMPVCHIGDYRVDDVTLAGLTATETVRQQLWLRNPAAADRPYRLHRDRAATICPGPNITHDLLNSFPRKDPTMPIPEWAAEAYEWAIANGVVVGDPDPGSAITEARLVVFLHRAALAIPDAPPPTHQQIREALQNQTLNLSTRATVM